MRHGVITALALVALAPGLAACGDSPLERGLTGGGTGVGARTAPWA